MGVGRPEDVSDQEQRMHVSIYNTLRRACHERQEFDI